MSLRWRIITAFLLVIILAVVIGIGLDYWAGSKEFSDFSAKIRTADLAAGISRQFTSNGSWDNLDSLLIRYGALLDEKRALAVEAGENDLKNKIPWRVVVKDQNGNILADTFSQLKSVPDNMGKELDTATIQDLDTGDIVGTVSVAINRDFLNAEAWDYLAGILGPRLLQGLITAIATTVLGIWLSLRITAPVIALTEATQRIVESGEMQLLPVKSMDELGRMSDSFNQMMATLESQRDLRKRLIDDLAHEINTPLSIIRLEAQGMQDGFKTPEEAAEQIIGEIDLLSNLVYDLNWLAETDSGALRFEMAVCELGGLLKAEVMRWQLQAQASDIELQLQPLPAGLPPVEVDAIRIGQALGNLIENALQHTPAGGRVMVQCKVDSEGILISVCDTGIGIPPEDQPHIFERFYRVDPSRQKEVGRHGLGLAIVRQIIEAHKGKVWAESTLGSGTCVHFHLPVEYINR